MFIDAQDEVTRKNGESYLEPHHIEKIVEVLSNYAAIDGFSTIAEINNIADNDYKLSINDYFDLIMIWFRDILYFKAANDVNGLIFKDEVYEIKRQAEKSSYRGIETILEALEKAKLRLNANVNFDLVIELLLLTIKEN